MKIFSSPGHDNNHINVEIDLEARRIFAGFARGMTSLNRRLAPTGEIIILEDLLFASSFCARLGAHPNGSMAVAVPDARRAFGITMRICTVHLEIIGPSQGLAVVLQLLGCITPVFIPQCSLPAAVEVFEDGKADDEVVLAYEHLRLWREPGDPLLPMLLAFQLWRRFSSQSPFPRCLQAFVESLEGITLAFRQTVESLHKNALDQIAPPARGSSK